MKKIILLLTITILLISCQTQNKTSGERYVVLSPEIYELLHAIDADDNIVGKIEECNYPKNSRETEVIGNFGQINFEKVLKLQPTKVFATGMEQGEISKQLKEFDVETIQIMSNDFDQLFANITTLGQAVEKESEAKKLVESIKNKLNSLDAKTENRPTVYVEIYGNPIMTVADSSFVGKLVNLAGGKNIFPELPRLYSRVSAEEVIKRNPDIILTTYPGVEAEQIKNRMGWEDINAVKNNRIYTINDINPDLILRTTPRSVDGIVKLSELFDKSE
jgi:iron complex transport system substrate-binding protein